jgi:hypothetical protein
MARKIRRKLAEFTVDVKLWLRQDTYDELAAEAEERDWSIPQVIRHRIKLGRGDSKPPTLAKVPVRAQGVAAKGPPPK